MRQLSEKNNNLESSVTGSDDICDPAEHRIVNDHKKILVVGWCYRFGDHCRYKMNGKLHGSS